MLLHNHLLHGAVRLLLKMDALPAAVDGTAAQVVIMHYAFFIMHYALDARGKRLTAHVERLGNAAEHQACSDGLVDVVHLTRQLVVQAERDTLALVGVNSDIYATTVADTLTTALTIDEGTHREA